MVVTASAFLPVELIFHPRWWYQNYGISFDSSFYFDLKTRIANDVSMRRTLYERYGDMGPGEKEPQPRPIIGSMHVAGGFVIPALFGCEVSFSEDGAPWMVPRQMSEDEVWSLEVPDIEKSSPMRELIQDMDALEAEYGYVVGDFDTDGVLNTALHLRGQRLFLDFYDAPDLVRHLFQVLAQTHVEVARYMRRRSGSCAIATNRMVARVDPRLYLHSNCSVQMISPQTYEEVLLETELYLAEGLQPYGIHHCGDNMHLLASLYAKVPALFFDVGWGSDVLACREALPRAFFNLRLSPMRMLQCTPQEVAADVERLLLEAGPLEQAGLCCINMDYGTPDENIFALFEVVERYRRYGA